MLLTSTGSNLYRDSSRNAQSSFSSKWSRLRSRVTKAEGKNAVPQLPFGTLRDQMSNWLGGEREAIVLPSVLYLIQPSSVLQFDDNVIPTLDS